jgi:hypothetical protein
MKGPIKADIWAYWGVADALCITTNGSLKAGGELVMGRGIALDAAQRFPGMALHLGRQVRQNGNKTQVVMGTTVPMGTPTALVALPTKPGDVRVKTTEEVMPQFRSQVRSGQMVQGWKMFSTLPLITRSLTELNQLADEHKWQSIVLPPPGAGNGGLDLNMVVGLCKEMLDDRFTMVHK